ncbi:unnamed protein product [Arctogadus glacialis]
MSLSRTGAKTGRFCVNPLMLCTESPITQRRPLHATAGDTAHLTPPPSADRDDETQEPNGPQRRQSCLQMEQTAALNFRATLAKRRLTIASMLKEGLFGGAPERSVRLETCCL